MPYKTKENWKNGKHFIFSRVCRVNNNNNHGKNYFSDDEKDASLKRSHESDEELENLNKKPKVESILDDIE